MQEQVWYDVKSIAEQGLILDLSGKQNYRYITRLISSGQLKAERIGGKYRVHIDWIKEFNTPSQ